MNEVCMYYYSIWEGHRRGWGWGWVASAALYVPCMRGEKTHLVVVHPVFRSCLVLAGGEVVWKHVDRWLPSKSPTSPASGQRPAASAQCQHRRQNQMSLLFPLRSGCRCPFRLVPCLLGCSLVRSFVRGLSLVRLHPVRLLFFSSYFLFIYSGDWNQAHRFHLMEPFHGDFSPAPSAPRCISRYGRLDWSTGSSGQPAHLGGPSFSLFTASIPEKQHEEWRHGKKRMN